jgi:tRNA pseudouridine38-40 synthase
VPHFKITLAYDGTRFVGWQRQADGASIQGLLEDALRELDDRPVTVHGAGRTDAGVHALGQVASFTLARTIDAGTVLRAMNARLPGEIRVLEATEVDVAFHARFSARRKTYRYRIWNGDVVSPFERDRVWHVTGALDLGAMRAAAQTLEGRHDFASFEAAGGMTKTSVREILSMKLSTTEDTVDTEEESLSHAGLNPRDLRVPHVLRGGDLIVFDITGDGFLRHMVRTIVGSLVEIGRGRRDGAWLHATVQARDRTLAGPTAPASGLFLVRVDYE